MEKSGRILTRSGTSRLRLALIQPTNMTPAQMMEGFNYVYNNFYSLKNIWKRMSVRPGQLLEHAFYFIANLKLNTTCATPRTLGNHL